MGSVVRSKHAKHLIVVSGPGTGKTTLVLNLHEKLNNLGTDPSPKGEIRLAFELMCSRVINQPYLD